MSVRLEVAMQAQIAHRATPELVNELAQVRVALRDPGKVHGGAADLGLRERFIRLELARRRTQRARKIEDDIGALRRLMNSSATPTPAERGALQRIADFIAGLDVIGTKGTP